MAEPAPVLLYNELTFFPRKYFPYKMQKIFLNADFTCPDRDGTRGLGGCTYCNSQAFNPGYCKTKKSVTRQLEKGKQFFTHKYPDMKYLVYFWVYTSTYDELEGLKRKYEEALNVDDVVGLVIGTCPDYMPDSPLHCPEELNKHSFLLVEYGIEAVRSVTLKRISQGHTYADTAETAQRIVACGILTGEHAILDLPGEGREEIIAQATELSHLPLTIPKMHQLQLIYGMKMAREFEFRPEGSHLLNADEYIDLIIDYMEHPRPDLILERLISQSSRELLITPGWGLKNYEFIARVQKGVKERDAYQGRICSVQKKRAVFAK